MAMTMDDDWYMGTYHDNNVQKTVLALGQEKEKKESEERAKSEIVQILLVVMPVVLTSNFNFWYAKNDHFGPF